VPPTDWHSLVLNNQCASKGHNAGMAALAVLRAATAAATLHC